MKTCRKCHIEKSLVEFSKDKSRPDGLHPYCKPCKKDIDDLSYLNNRDKRLESCKQYIANNKELVANRKRVYAEKHAVEIAAYQLQYRTDNAIYLKFTKMAYFVEHRDVCLQISKEYARLNPGITRESSARYRANNPEKRRESANRYVRAHPDKNIANSGKRRAVKVQAFPKWFGELDTFIFIEAARLCASRYVATNIKWHVDHIVPLNSKLVCGLHIGCNVQLLPARINIAKGNRHWPNMWTQK
jgi:hypothetical protein